MLIAESVRPENVIGVVVNGISTSITNRFANNKDENIERAHGLFTKKEIINDKIVGLLFWDGEQGWSQQMMKLVKTGKIILFVYDITDRGAFEEIKKTIQLEINRLKNKIIMLVGNNIEKRYERKVK